MNNPRILAIGRANPPLRFTQEQAYRMAGYHSPKILEIFLNSDIDYRHFYIDPEHFSRDETPDQLNQRYLRGAMETGCHAVNACLDSGSFTTQDVDCFFVCTCTGYLCPDLGSRLIGHMKFRRDVERGAMLGLGCAGAQVVSSCEATSMKRARPALRIYDLRLSKRIWGNGGIGVTEARVFLPAPSR